MRAMTEYDDRITRLKAGTKVAKVEDADLGSGPEVQLSVRLPQALRSAVCAAADRAGVTVQHFVRLHLTRAVAESADPFVGIAAELTTETRRALREAIDDGSYVAAAEVIDREDATSAN